MQLHLNYVHSRLVNLYDTGPLRTPRLIIVSRVFPFPEYLYQFLSNGGMTNDLKICGPYGGCGPEYRPQYGFQAISKD